MFCNNKYFKKALATVFGLFIICLNPLQLFGKDRAFEAVLPYLPNNPVIVEAGAHNGRDTLLMAKKWPGGKIFAFECRPDVFDTLRNKTDNYNNIECFPLALGAEEKDAIFYVSAPVNPNDKTCDAQSSLLPPSEKNWPWDHVQFQKPITVQVTTLDQWARDNQVDHVDFLWLDTQGSEGHILKASPAILKTVKAIKTEYSEKPFYEGTMCFQEYCKFLHAQGFVCIYKDKGAHGDAAFVRKKLLSHRER